MELQVYNTSLGIKNRNGKEKKDFIELNGKNRKRRDISPPRVSPSQMVKSL